MSVIRVSTRSPYEHGTVICPECYMAPGRPCLEPRRGVGGRTYLFKIHDARRVLQDAIEAGDTETVDRIKAELADKLIKLQATSQERPAQRTKKSSRRKSLTR